MVHTLLPWTSKYRLVTVFGNIDDSELAARLGALSLLDRRGNYVWHDDFEGTVLKWNVGVVAQGGAAAICTDTCYMGSQCCKLVTDSTTGDTARLEKKFHFPSDSNLGFELMANLGDVASEFDITCRGYDGTSIFQASLQWRQATNDLWIFDEATGWVQIATTIMPVYDDHFWLPFKMVFDWQTKYYTRAIVGNTEYDISSYEISYAASAVSPYLQLWIQYTTKSNDSRTAYVDNFIFTQNDV